MVKKKKVQKLDKLYNKARIKQNSLEDAKFIENLKETIDDDHAKNSKAKIKSSETYKHHEFLEMDHLRLQNIERLYSKKLFILSNFSQTESLIAGQNEEIAFIKDKLTDILLLEDSRYLNRIEYIWNDSFGQEE